MTLLSTQDETRRQPQQTRGGWIEAALAVLVEGGIEAVQITQLARHLGVTRGSFYWHFKSREALLEALIREWRARNSDVMLSALAEAASLQAGILELFSVWVDHRRFDPALDQAVRDWARRSEAVRESVAREDDSRVGAIAGFFERHGYQANEAFIRARVLYFTQVSYYALGIQEPMPERMSYLEAYYRCFTGQEIEAEAAAAFGARLLRSEGERP